MTLFLNLISGNYTLEELSLLSDQDDLIMKVPHEENSKKKESLSKTYSISSGPDPGVKFTAIKGIKLQENPRQIIFPAHFDGHIQIDVGLTSNFNFTLFSHPPAIRVSMNIQFDLMIFWMEAYL